MSKKRKLNEQSMKPTGFPNMQDWSERVPRYGDPEAVLIPEIKWGSPGMVFTPAYWAEVVARHRSAEQSAVTFRLGSTFKEECVACLLGGHGIPGDVGNAAFR